MSEASSTMIKQKRSSMTNNKPKPEVSQPMAMEEIEKRQLSQHIGIDYEIEKEKYNWFLSQVLQLNAK